MAFLLNQAKQVSQWVDFESEGIKAKIKVRGIKHKPYVIANERIQSNFNVSGLRLKNIAENELSMQDMIFQVVGEYLIEDWQNIAIEKDGIVKDIPYSKDAAFELMSFGGDAGLSLWDFVIQSARKIQEDADNYKEEVMGKSEVSTDGKSTERKPAKSQRNKPTSTNG